MLPKEAFSFLYKLTLLKNSGEHQKKQDFSLKVNETV